MPQKLAYYSFRYLFASVEALKKDIDLNNVKLSEKLAVLTLVAFTYESFLNHVGHQVFKSFDEHLKPKLSPEGKMAFFCEIGKIQPDFGRSPFQTFKKVMTLRNKLAHAETEYLSYDPLIHTSPDKWPRSQWQVMVEKLEISRVISDLEEIMKLLECSLKLPPTPSFLLMEAIEINE